MIKKINERYLQEGPGAGYTITGTIKDAKVNSFKVVDKEVDKYGDVTYVIECDVDANLVDINAQSYYYGSTVGKTAIKVDKIYLIYDSSNFEEGESVEPTATDIKYALDSIDINSSIGAGYLHSTFDGVIEDDELEDYYSDPHLDYVMLHFTNNYAINFIDKAVQGENTQIEYVVNYEDDEEDYFENEDEAIEYAKKNKGISVEKRTYWYNIMDDGESEDITDSETETIWEREWTKSYRYESKILNRKLSESYNYNIDEKYLPARDMIQKGVELFFEIAEDRDDVLDVVMDALGKAEDKFEIDDNGTILGRIKD